MPEFLKGNHLNSKLDSILENADRRLILISPFIKFHSRIKEILKTKLHNDELQISVVFGKNDNQLQKSLSEDDFKFLAEFPNIELRYEPRLHAKYYANDSASLLSSMNLYEYSQNNNIEFGIYSETGFLNKIISSPTLDTEAWNYFFGVIEDSELMFQKLPVYENRMMGLTKKYVRSEIDIDKLSSIYGGISRKNSSSFQNKPQSKGVSQNEKIGFCIRTGVKIPFNINKPFTAQAFESWNRYQNPDFAEKYCHFSGEESNGKTSMAKPVLAKNWKKSL